MMKKSPITHVLILALAIALPAFASAQARIDSIRIVGNKTTQAQVILREMSVKAGDRADPTAIENSRQAIQDLGLFREVDIEQEAQGEAVALIVRVREKRYLLPIPRLDANSDGDYSVGAQLRWSNVFGLNHRLIAYVEEERFKSERDRTSQRSAQISYNAPYIGDSAYSLGLFVDHSEQRSLDRTGRPFDETFDRFQVLATRDYRLTRPRRGWILGTGLYWQDQVADGEFAPVDDGTATALVGIAEYADLRFHGYSQSGQRFSARVETATKRALSDYSYRRLDLNYRHYRPFGRREHQTVHLLAAAGVVDDGPRSRNDYSLGGSTRMRGYERDTIEGARYWYLSGEYLRPLRWNWLRLLANVELGSARDNVFGQRNRRLYASVGLGLRARITWFVDIEIEAGIALPLIDGDGLRFFASTL